MVGVREVDPIGSQVEQEAGTSVMKLVGIRSSLIAVIVLSMGHPLVLAQQGGFRRLAPGVLTSIAGEVLPEETVTRSVMPALLATSDLPWDPKLAASSRTLEELAKRAEFRRTVHCLDFQFKPLRMIEVDIPQPSGRVQRKLVWYLVYAVTNSGKNLGPSEQESGLVEISAGEGMPQRFLPQFVLESQHRGANGRRVSKAYADQIIPLAIPQIRDREDRNRPLLSSVEMSGKDIAVGDTIWGVAVWQDLDPELDFFSIYIAGLSNAYRWVDSQPKLVAGSAPTSGRQFYHKALQLNFWRPGDAIDENENEIRFGVPMGKSDLYGVEEGVAYRWSYR